ncbi:unnamed protein product, partial [Mesorhabditis spiculigera]
MSDLKPQGDNLAIDEPNDASFLTQNLLKTASDPSAEYCGLLGFDRAQILIFLCLIVLIVVAQLGTYLYWRLYSPIIFDFFEKEQRDREAKAAGEKENGGSQF